MPLFRRRRHGVNSPLQAGQYPFPAQHGQSVKERRGYAAPGDRRPQYAKKAAGRKIQFYAVGPQQFL